jgi:hypothetical protein
MESGQDENKSGMVETEEEDGMENGWKKSKVGGKRRWVETWKWKWVENGNDGSKLELRNFGKMVIISQKSWRYSPLKAEPLRPKCRWRNLAKTENDGMENKCSGMESGMESQDGKVSDYEF